MSWHVECEKLRSIMIECAIAKFYRIYVSVFYEELSGLLPDCQWVRHQLKQASNKQSLQVNIARNSWKTSKNWKRLGTVHKLEGVVYRYFKKGFVA